VRWEALFAELAAELQATEAADADHEMRAAARRESSGLRLFDRLVAARGAQVTVRVPAAVLHGRLSDNGPDWLLLAEAPGRDALIPTSAIATITGLGRWSGVPGAEGAVGARLELGHALRGIKRDRSPVTVTLADGFTCSGTIDRVGADFVEIAEHPTAEARRSAAVTGVSTLPRSAIVVVRSV
jgi:hypothetical protein